MCVTMCPPCKHSQIACSVGTCVPDIEAQPWLRTAGDFVSFKWLPLPFLILSLFSLYHLISYLSLPCHLKACLHSEGHMDDGLTLQRCQHEESRAARIIRNSTLLFNRFIRYVEKYCAITYWCK